MILVLSILFMISSFQKIFHIFILNVYYGWNRVCGKRCHWSECKKRNTMIFFKTWRGFWFYCNEQHWKNFKEYCSVSYQFLRCKIEGQNAKLFVSITRNSANTYKKMHAFFGANEDSWFEDVERTVTGFLPDKMVTQIF